MLADADLGLVPLADTPAGEPGAVLLHRSGLLDALDALFESVWRTAHPLELSDPGGEAETTVELGAEGPTDLDRRILAPLLAGLTDPTAATQLGLSPRTLHRRLRRLMDICGTQRGRPVDNRLRRLIDPHRQRARSGTTRIGAAAGEGIFCSVQIVLPWFVKRAPHRWASSALMNSPRPPSSVVCACRRCGARRLESLTSRIRVGPLMRRNRSGGAP
ncbi:hypothetical protein [Streptomyces sp. CB01635]|uniref:hypothetical protein n=1 Tax=unclassified Streptomyces TaxID=2593676 RepID=UPI002D77E3C9|nr:hypothetical protein [Streptomyces sp. CB01635]